MSRQQRETKVARKKNIRNTRAYRIGRLHGMLEAFFHASAKDLREYGALHSLAEYLKLPSLLLAVQMRVQLNSGTYQIREVVDWMAENELTFEDLNYHRDEEDEE